jgi:hypothetical protein
VSVAAIIRELVSEVEISLGSGSPKARTMY